MKCILQNLLILLLFQAPMAWATSTIFFEGGKYLVEVVVSDTNDSVANVRVFRGKTLLISVEGKELKDVACSLEKQIIKFVLPANDGSQKLMLNANGGKAELRYRGKTIELKSDWLH